MTSRATPPPLDRQITPPPAPRFGTFHDDWNPRRSARISSRNGAGTPNDSSPNRYSSHSDSLSPKKRPAPESIRLQLRAGLDGHIDSSEATAAQNKQSRRSGTNALLTPSKTPRKFSKDKNVTDVGSFARNLFPSNDLELDSSKRQRRAKRYSGMTLESFRVEEEVEPLEIFEDSRDRVPERDDNSENPFWDVEASQQRHTRRTSNRGKVYVPGEGRQPIDQAVQREDGMVYVFRGKKIFRKYSEQEPQTTIEGRILFPTAEVEAEEAATDIEIEDTELENDLEPQTPAKPSKLLPNKSGPSEVNNFEPLSPPDTWKTKRTVDKFETSESKKPKHSGHRNPFDGWLRRKNSSESSPSKRKNDGPVNSTAKRTRAQ